jgi:flagellar motor switch protein FliM
MSDILSQSEIDNLLASLSGGATTKEAQKSPGAKEMEANLPIAVSIEEPIEEDKRGYKLYNFRRPDKFSKDHLRALQDIHKEFSRQFSLVMTAYLRMPVEIEIISVDQLTYDEFTRSMPSPITVGILELSPLPGQILVGLSHEVLTSIVDRMLGGVGNGESSPRELTDIEESLAKKVLERLTRSLETAWKTIFPIQGQVVDIDNNYSLIQVCNPGEIVALITLEIQISSKQSGLLSLCFPFPVLETVIGQLSSQHIFQAKGMLTSSEDKQKMLEKLHAAKIPANVILGSTDISLQDFTELKEGDVIKLDCSVNDDLMICINGETKFSGRPGTSKNHIAVKIVDKYIEKEDN